MRLMDAIIQNKIRYLEQHAPPVLSSGLPLLDELLEGGLHEGELSEWGMPWGQGLRELLLPFLAAAQRKDYWILWIYGQSKICVNPLAWKARAVDLNRIRFAQSEHALRDLRPVFLSDFFRLIVIDQSKQLSDEDCAFLARQARRLRQSILILKPYALSHTQGNVWARLRVNCGQDLQSRMFRAELLKGRHPKQLLFSTRQWMESNSHNNEF